MARARIVDSLERSQFDSQSVAESMKCRLACVVRYSERDRHDSRYASDLHDPAIARGNEKMHKLLHERHGGEYIDLEEGADVR